MPRVGDQDGPSHGAEGLSAGCVPPRYTIDLSLPPQERYKTLALQYKPQLQSLTQLFDDLLLSLGIPVRYLSPINKASKFFLRRVHDTEQTKELRGISDVTQIPMYLLVAFNVILDLLMGCTSGGVRSHEPGQPPTQTTMLHFRTLDWTMDPLRHVVVQLDFIRSKSSSSSHYSSSKTPPKILASSITYLGFVGVLTGIKPGLSMSLNFRAVHNAQTRYQHFRFYFHHLLVLLGFRPSIASMLRHYLLDGNDAGRYTDPAEIAARLWSRHTTAAYIILSDGARTSTMEKDYSTAKAKTSSSFIAVTNHDKSGSARENNKPPILVVEEVVKGVPFDRNALTSLELLIEESTDRLRCIEQKWNAKLKRVQGTGRRSKTSKSASGATKGQISVTKEELIEWICDWPTSNECTHYAVILDPSEGEVAWARVYPEPLRDPNAQEETEYNSD